MEEKKRAILVVSFGTSFADTREKTIDRIEQEIGKVCQNYQVYRAWTSKMIRSKLEKRDGIRIPDVAGAMEQILADGIREVVLQPTHMLNGIENDEMRAIAAAYADRFEGMVIGAPVLTSQEDLQSMIEAVAAEFTPEPEDALVFMGHGTEHYANSVYAALDYQFKDQGYSNIYMGTVEAYPDLAALMRRIREQHPRTVYLAPFMIVAGDHASNDLAGEDPDSWKSQFTAGGFSVHCILKGLGEYPGVRSLLIAHTLKACEQLEQGIKVSKGEQ